MPLKEISIGWQWLERTLNAIIDEVNLNKPLGSASIAIDQHPNGTTLRVVEAKQPTQQQSGAGGGTSGAQPTQAPPVWHNVGWQTVTIVDPVSCAQSTIQVLVQQPGGSLTIT